MAHLRCICRRSPSFHIRLAPELEALVISQLAAAEDIEVEFFVVFGGGSTAGNDQFSMPILGGQLYTRPHRGQHLRGGLSTVQQYLSSATPVLSGLFRKQTKALVSKPRDRDKRTKKDQRKKRPKTLCPEQGSNLRPQDCPAMGPVIQVV
jgi:hypothetical protein